MRDAIGQVGELNGLSSGFGQEYLFAVDDIFQGLRRCVTSLSAMVLLLQVGRRISDLPLEMGLDTTGGEVQELLEKARALDKRFSKLPAHRSLVSSCMMTKRATGELRTTLQRDPIRRADALPSALASIQRAYDGLRSFSSVTPWDPTTINSSCACAIQ